MYQAQDEADEAQFIVNSIRDTSDNYNQFAVLYRTNNQSRALEEALIAAGIPYRIYGGLKFYDRKEIKDAIAYLKLVYNTDDSQSLRRIVNVPKRAIGETTLKHLQEYADENDLSLFGAIKDVDNISTIKSGTATKLKDFATLIEKLKEAEKKYSLPEFLGIVLERSGYLKELHDSNTDEDEIRIENLQELVNVANEFEPEEDDIGTGLVPDPLSGSGCIELHLKSTTVCGQIGGEYFDINGNKKLDPEELAAMKAYVEAMLSKKPQKADNVNKPNGIINPVKPNNDFMLILIGMLIAQMLQQQQQNNDFLGNNGDKAAKKPLLQEVA